MSGLESAQQALESSLSERHESAHEGTEPSSVEQQSASNPEQVERPPQIVDLDTLEKVKYKGKEWTQQDLHRAFMAQQDYSKKAQAISEERKYYDNLQADLENVAGDPRLAEKFKELYPEKFHKFLDYVLKNSDQKDESVQKPQIDQALEERLARMEKAAQLMEAKELEASIKTAESNIDSVFKKFSSKYSMADEETVLSRAQLYWEQNKQELLANGNKQIPEDVWESIFKGVNERNQKMADGYYKQKVDSQKQAGVKAKDTAAGGGIPGQAPKKMSMKEATDAAIEHFSSR